MADTISDLTGAEREQRVAELKRKMLEAAKKAKAAHAAGEPETPKAVATPAAVRAAPATAVMEAPAPVAPATETEVVITPTPTGGNGATAAEAPRPRPAPKPAPKPVATAAPQADAPSKGDMNRREFLTYSWGAALGLLGIETLAVTFFFMYPRFKVGEFGGVFFIGPESSLPAPTDPPVPHTNGKFWMIRTTEEEPKALYMVCTHLGCLYKWVGSNNRFECPCHGSKFSHDGFYIEGPAPRSLDHFETTVTETGEVAVNTGKKIPGLPSALSPARAVPA